MQASGCICICHRLCWTLAHMPYVCPPAPAPRLLVSPVLLSYKRRSRVDTGRGRWSRPGVRMKGQRMWYKRGKQAVAQTHGGMETACTFVSCAETCGRWGHADATRLKDSSKNSTWVLKRGVLSLEPPCQRQHQQSGGNEGAEAWPGGQQQNSERRYRSTATGRVAVRG